MLERIGGLRRVTGRRVAAVRGRSGGEDLEGDRAQVVSGSEADGGVERGGQAPEQRDSRLGAALLDALDVVLGHRGPVGQFSDGQAEFGADVVQGLDAGQSQPREQWPALRSVGGRADRGDEAMHSRRRVVMGELSSVALVAGV